MGFFSHSADKVLQDKVPLNPPPIQMKMGASRERSVDDKTINTIQADGMQESRAATTQKEGPGFMSPTSCEPPAARIKSRARYWYVPCSKKPTK
ncbi:hypothetical protein LZ30DRAFT_734156 [Colletotrichum cereale]|nr:hypothetical protein LZ30DRAFT_734156 [Colletotrichum cereale]